MFYKNVKAYRLLKSADKSFKYDLFLKDKPIENARLYRGSRCICGDIDIKFFNEEIEYNEYRPSYFMGHIFPQYGHFLIESLGRLDERFFKLIKLRKIEKLYAYSHFDHTKYNFVNYVFDKLGLKINLIDRNIHFSNIFIIKNHSNIKTHISDDMKYVYNRLSSNIVNKFKCTYSKIYISRLNIKKRKLLNEEEIISKLKRLNFFIFEPQKYDLEDQIYLFRNAKIIIGPIGAALHNFVFSKNVQKIVLAPKYTPILENYLVIDEFTKKSSQYIFGTELMDDTWSLPIKNLEEIV